MIETIIKDNISEEEREGLCKAYQHFGLSVQNSQKIDYTTLTGAHTTTSGASIGLARRGAIFKGNIFGGSTSSSNSVTSFSSERTAYFTITFQRNTEMKNYHQLKDLQEEFDVHYEEAQRLYGQADYYNAKLQKSLKTATKVLSALIITIPIAFITMIAGLAMKKKHCKKAKNLFPYIQKEEEKIKQIVNEASSIEK